MNLEIATGQFVGMKWGNMAAIKFMFCFFLIIGLSSCTIKEGLNSQDEVFSLIKQNHFEIEKLLLKIDWRTGTTVVHLSKSSNLIEQNLYQLGVLSASQNKDGAYLVFLSYEANRLGWGGGLERGAIWSPQKQLENSNRIIKDWYYFKKVR
jgi:hypothetical protein